MAGHKEEKTKNKHEPDHLAKVVLAIAIVKRSNLRRVQEEYKESTWKLDGSDARDI